MHPKVQRLLFCKIFDFQYSAEEETIDTHTQMWCLFTRWYDDDPSIFFWTSTCIDYFPTPPPPHIYSQTQIGDRPPWPLHFSLQYVGTSTKNSINFFARISKRKTLLVNGMDLMVLVLPFETKLWPVYYSYAYINIFLNFDMHRLFPTPPPPHI